MHRRLFNVAVVGATGAVGREMVKILEERNFPVNSLKLFASGRSAGQTLEFQGESISVEVLKQGVFKGINIVLSSAGGEVSKNFVPDALKDGALVIDNTSAFRMDVDVPLVVPEVNGEDCKKHKGIIANPNCSTIQLVAVLKPIHINYILKRVIVSSYQAVSGKGKKGMDELSQQIISLFSHKPFDTKVFPHQIAFNCIPHIDEFLSDGYTKEEMKVINETKKILSLPDLPITATTVRVSVFNCHSESVNIEVEKPIEPEDVKKILSSTEGIVVEDDPKNSIYPLPTYSSGKDNVFVGRIRKDFSIKNGINLWIVADNLRKGAALNAVQIAEYVGRENLV